MAPKCSSDFWNRNYVGFLNAYPFPFLVGWLLYYNPQTVFLLFKRFRSMIKTIADWLADVYFNLFISILKYNLRHSFISCSKCVHILFALHFIASGSIFMSYDYGFVVRAAEVSVVFRRARRIIVFRCLWYRFDFITLVWNARWFE